jgi:preprotein translocase SecE subunit
MSTKTPTPPTNKPQTEPQQSFWLPEYFKGVKAEWTKITWPTRVQVISQTIVVLIMVAIMTLGLWLTDRILYDGLLCHVIPNGQERCYDQK